MNKNILLGEKEEAVEGKKYIIPVEHSFEIDLPKEVIDALKLESGDTILFYQDDDGQILLQKA